MCTQIRHHVLNPVQTRQSALLLGCRLGLLLLDWPFCVPHTKQGRLSRDFERRWQGTNTDTSTLRVPRRSYLEWMPNVQPRLILWIIFVFATCLHNWSDLLVHVSLQLYIVSMSPSYLLICMSSMNVYIFTTKWHQPACHTSFWLDELVNESLQLLWSLKTS